MGKWLILSHLILTSLDKFTGLYLGQPKKSINANGRDFYNIYCSAFKTGS